MTYQLKPDYWSHYKRLKFIEKFVKEYDHPTVLDLGCGTGILVAFPLAEQGYEVTGVDIDSRSINAANKENPFPNLKFICKDFHDFCPGKKYDIIIAAEIIEHLQDPASLLVAVKKLLKPGGTAIITFPNGYGLHEVEAVFYHQFFEPWGFVHHIRYFNRSVSAIKLWILGQALVWPKYMAPDQHLEMTVNLECGHVCRLTVDKFTRMCKETGFQIVEQQSGALLHGQVTGHTIGALASLSKMNTDIVEYLPSWMAARWFFAIRSTE